MQPWNLAGCQKSKGKRWKTRWDIIEHRWELRVIRLPIVRSLTHKHHPAAISYIMDIMGNNLFIYFRLFLFPYWPLLCNIFLFALMRKQVSSQLWLSFIFIFVTSCLSFSSAYVHSYSTYSNEVGYSSPYGYSVTSQQTMGYDISADYVDSTTTYEPRSTIIDSDFIGTHSKWDFIRFYCLVWVFLYFSC